MLSCSAVRIVASQFRIAQFPFVCHGDDDDERREEFELFFGFRTVLHCVQRHPHALFFLFVVCNAFLVAPTYMYWFPTLLTAWFPPLDVSRCTVVSRVGRSGVSPKDAFMTFLGIGIAMCCHSVGVRLFIWCSLWVIPATKFSTVRIGIPNDCAALCFCLDTAVCMVWAWRCEPHCTAFRRGGYGSG